jgi:hypothetical protein
MLGFAPKQYRIDAYAMRFLILIALLQSLLEELSGREENRRIGGRPAYPVIKPVREDAPAQRNARLLQYSQRANRFMHRKWRVDYQARHTGPGGLLCLVGMLDSFDEQPLAS